MADARICSSTSALAESCPLEARVGVGGWGQTCTARARVARGRERVAGRAIYGIGREGRESFTGARRRALRARSQSVQKGEVHREGDAGLEEGRGVRRCL